MTLGPWFFFLGIILCLGLIAWRRLAPAKRSFHTEIRPTGFIHVNTTNLNHTLYASANGRRTFIFCDQQQANWKTGYVIIAGPKKWKILSVQAGLAEVKELK